MRVLLLAALLAAAAPAAALAQAGNCRLDQDASGSVTVTETVTSVRGVVVRCHGGAQTILANEANIFTATGQTHLFGNVVFSDQQKRLTSHTAIYHSATGWLHATGDVVFNDAETGSTLRGPDVEYYRAMPNRPQAQVIASLRPTLTIRSAGAAGRPAETIDVDADRILIIGNNLNAYGNVVLRRPDMTARSGEAFYDRDNGRMTLTGSARMENERFDLSAQQIEARLLDGALEQLTGRTGAILTGEELRVDAPEIRLSFGSERLERLVARGDATGVAPQPVAVSPGFVIRGDSIDARLPGQRLEQVVAVGTARGETRDTTGATGRPLQPAGAAGQLSLEQNWILGDTIIGHFAPADSSAAPADSAVVLTRIVAAGTARSLYQLEPQDRGAAAPQPTADGASGASRRGLNYLSGERIELTFARGQVENAEVQGLQRGIYLDPVAPGTRTEPAATTAAAAPAAPAQR